MINDLHRQKFELIGWYKITKDKAIRKEIRKLDKKIVKELENERQCKLYAGCRN